MTALRILTGYGLYPDGYSWCNGAPAGCRAGRFRAVPVPGSVRSWMQSHYQQRDSPVPTTLPVTLFAVSMTAWATWYVWGYPRITEILLTASRAV